MLPVLDVITLTPEGPLDGEWDENGIPYSESGTRRETREQDSGEVVEARAEALNDALRPLDRCDNIKVYDTFRPKPREECF